MEKLNTILTFIGFIIMTPIWIMAIALVVMGIIGLVKKNFVNFKKILKIWGYFWLAFLVLMIIKFIVNFFSLQA